MVAVEGAEHASKAMPVNVDSAAMAGVSAVGAAACGAALAVVPDPAAPGLVGAAKEVVGAGVAGGVGVGDATAEARTPSTDELLAAHVASSSPPAATNCACLSWLTGSTPTRADSVPTVATWDVDVDGVADWPSWPVAAGFSQMVSARPTGCAGHFDCVPGDPRYSALRSRRTHALGCSRRSPTGQAAGTLIRTPS